MDFKLFLYKSSTHVEGVVLCDITPPAVWQEVEEKLKLDSSHWMYQFEFWTKKKSYFDGKIQ
jgi:hypothetical protein